MTTAFPQTMDFTGYNVPSRVEADIYDLIVDGKIPDEINGRWYRVTPIRSIRPTSGTTLICLATAWPACSSSRTASSTSRAAM